MGILRPPVTVFPRSGRRRRGLSGAAFALLFILLGWPPAVQGSRTRCLERFSDEDGNPVADPAGRLLAARNTARDYVPASTLKVLTALTALHQLGPATAFDGVLSGRRRGPGDQGLRRPPAALRSVEGDRG